MRSWQAADWQPRSLLEQAALLSLPRGKVWPSDACVPGQSNSGSYFILREFRRYWYTRNNVNWLIYTIRNWVTRNRSFHLTNAFCLCRQAGCKAIMRVRKLLNEQASEKIELLFNLNVSWHQDKAKSLKNIFK